MVLYEVMDEFDIPPTRFDYTEYGSRPKWLSTLTTDDFVVFAKRSKKGLTCIYPGPEKAEKVCKKLGAEEPRWIQLSKWTLECVAFQILSLLTLNFFTVEYGQHCNCRSTQQYKDMIAPIPFVGRSEDKIFHGLCKHGAELHRFYCPISNPTGTRKIVAWFIGMQVHGNSLSDYVGETRIWKTSASIPSKLL